MIYRLLADIEVSPNLGYFWKPGYKLTILPENIVRERAIICISYKWEHEDKVRTLKWDDGDDTRVIEGILPILDKADEVIGHNGDRFDFPWINTRAVKLGHRPVSQFRQVDTLKIARRYFHFNSNKLDYLARFLLGDKKAETGGFDLWRDVTDGETKTKRNQALKIMINYCEKDVLLLERVYKELRSYAPVATHQGVMDGEERWTCPQCGTAKVHKNKTTFTKAGMRRHEMKCTEKACGRYYSIADNLFNDYLARFSLLENQ